MSKTRGWILRSVAACLSGLCVNTLHAQQGDYEQVELKESGTIVGVVRYEGKVPKPKELKVTTGDKPCHKGPIMSEKLVLSAGKQVKFAVASIKWIGRGKAFPEQDAQYCASCSTLSPSFTAATDVLADRRSTQRNR